MEGAGGASCQGGQLCAAWNKCFTAAAPRDLIKKVVQKCVCPFAVCFCCFFEQNVTEFHENNKLLELSVWCIAYITSGVKKQLSAPTPFFALVFS
jgi:hypothetical protein